jgi:D-alanyl-D-alanine carboxypeptidase (penicillin-binding protein 5/6)
VTVFPLVDDGAAGQRVAARRAAPKREVGPAAAILLDVRTGQVLYAREINKRLAPASTTKILTAILAIERFSIDTPVIISARAAAQRSGAAIGLEAGEQWTVGELLHAMLMRSANDAAVAVAEAYSGSVEAFAGEMNRKAYRIGARNSHFVNPHGLSAPGHYTTAHDLALIARYAMRLPVFASLVRQQTWTLERHDRVPHEYSNINKFLSKYEGADGVKTGWTAAAGHCLVASATRNGWQLLAVVLHSQEIYRNASQMLDFGFEAYSPRKLAGRGDPLVTLNTNLWRSNVVGVVPTDVVAVVKRGAAVSSQIKLRSDLHPPVAPGAPVGEVIFFADQAVVARSALVAASAKSR